MIKKEDKMRPARLKTETGTMTLAEALGWAASHINPQTGWLLAEAPQKTLWRRLTDVQDGDLAGECQSLLIFGPEAELRLHKGYSDQSGQVRLVFEDPAGEEGFERVSAYLLGKEGATLKYAEFFRPNEKSGLYQLRFARYCGVGGSR